VLTGNGGANVLKGLGGNDVLDGGAGTDRLDGGAGDDIYRITAFGDHTSAEIADSGSGGRDEIRIATGLAGQFTAYAGERGIERIVVGTGTAAVADRSSTAAINVDAAALTRGAIIVGNAGANGLTGTSGDDLIGGGLGGDALAGGNGADTLFGGEGTDSLSGGAGNDLLYGGGSVDTLTGGLGVDTFAIGTDPYEGVDKITDFTSGTDKLLVINSYLSGYLLSGGFRSGTYAQDADDLAIYDKGSGKLYVDYDGNGPQAQVLLANFTPGTNLAASDVLLIDSGSWLQQTFAAQQELLL
jgi:Ca2+-binding RTX toxin-like protein